MNICLNIQVELSNSTQVLIEYSFKGDVVFGPHLDIAARVRYFHDVFQWVADEVSSSASIDQLITQAAAVV